MSEDTTVKEAKEIKNKENRDNKEPYIVGIGASAGGLEALQKLLTALPANTGFPYIVIQHLSPDYKSLMGEILSKYTEMPVLQVEDGMEIKPDYVYVIQPGKNMRVSNGKLMLSSQKEKELNLPIDMFFRSLAEEAGAHAIAIVLSGTGSDGTNGIKTIKENDGMIIVQEPDNAKFDGMPRSALRTGLVDAQLTPEEIALELQHISNTTHSGTQPLKTERQIDEELMKRIYAILKKISNVNFTHYKQNTILRRIERRMMLTHKETLQDYVDFLYESSDEVKTLSKEILIGVTNFFRDPEFFQSLKEKAIQNILIHSTAEEPIRAWVAGCSTGEEAYSIAILFCEVMETLKIKRTIKIFATDLDVEAVTFAGKGTYSENIIDSVSTARLSHYFTRQNNTYAVNRDIRKMIVFSPHNVFQDPPFGKLDLISCRNMLIYFQPVLQNDLFAIFHNSLRDGGYLFLGKSEAIGAYTEAYPVVDAAAKIFSHRADIKIAGAKAIPFLQNGLMDEDFLEDPDSHRDRKVNMGEIDMTERDSIDTTLLERFMPACLIVNDKNELVHTYGENSNYVHFSIGKVSNGLYDVLTEALKIPVSTLLKEAREKQQMVQYKDICFNGEREEAIINLTATPIGKKELTRENYYGLIFTDTKQRGELAEAIPYEIDRVASQRITDLEQDLSGVQDKLNRSVTEQECVNEELQAANEELLTANDELQSSNEELQSVNEELYTVNTEYQLKLTELADMNDDIANFLSSTLIGMIFVDNKLSIRRYTDYVASEFSVMDHDIGRSLKFISYHFPTVDIIEICDNVLKTLVPDEREVMTGKKKIFFMRVAPYRTTENKILGCVITLVDVTTQKQGQAKLENAEQKLNIAQQASDAKSDYLSKIAHEIRTPMLELKGVAEKARAQVEDREALGSSLSKMSDTIQYMNSIVADILAMTKADQFDAETPVEPFSMPDVIDKVVSIINPEIEKAGLHFNLSVPDRFDSFYVGSKSRLQQILLNFLSNAVKYTPRGGQIGLKVAEEATVNHKTSICFVISDTGIGISESFIPNLFKPFAREKRNDANESSSMGLGLSIAYNLINLMNGDVKVESKVGKGSTFTIHVLLEQYTDQDGNPVKMNTIEELQDYQLSGCHALIVDDNEMNRKILGSLLAYEGMTYVEAEGGAEAVATYMEAPEKAFDCILMDIRMPQVDGIMATEQIRESGRVDAHTIPILGVSANGFPEDIEKAKNVGMDCYLTKPIDNDKLFMTISELIQRK
ncbi:MAG: chemotaxis protein CheB [bacterium]|nr:chemotaxis protein CheB [bacterium]